jgi:hypothetical protein
MRKKILLIFVCATVFFFISGLHYVIQISQTTSTEIETMVEHHNIEDQIYLENHISFITESTYLSIQQPSTNLLDNYSQIWKPPVNS